jgi:hypothetical protein
MAPAYYDIDKELRSDDDLADLKQVSTHWRHLHPAQHARAPKAYLFSAYACSAALTRKKMLLIIVERLSGMFTLRMDRMCNVVVFCVLSPGNIGVLLLAVALERSPRRRIVHQRSSMGIIPLPFSVGNAPCNLQWPSLKWAVNTP